MHSKIAYFMAHISMGNQAMAGTFATLTVEMPHDMLIIIIALLNTETGTKHFKPHDDSIVIISDLRLVEVHTWSFNSV